MVRVYTDPKGLWTGGYAVQENGQSVIFFPSLNFDTLTETSSTAYALDPDSTIKYSGHVVAFHSEYPPLLRKIQDEVEQRLGLTFDHVMLGLYEDGSVYIGKHRDNIKERRVFDFSIAVDYC